MKIGELAEKAGLPVETVRYYEKEGLLPGVARTQGNYRIYTDDHAERLLFIRHCRSLDMTLEEIRILLHFKDKPDESCDRVNALLDAHIGHVCERIRDLEKLVWQHRLCLIGTSHYPAKLPCFQTRNLTGMGKAPSSGL